MRDVGPRSIQFDFEEYARSRVHTQKLAKQLNQGSVEVFAREVIRTLASKRQRQDMEAPSADQVDHLCFALVSDDDGVAAQFIRDAQSRGASVEAIYLTYLAPAARRLGSWWDDDHISFLEVTIGTGRIYAILSAVRREFAVCRKLNGKSAVFAAVPGETHTLGVRMAADLFRKDGWSVDLKIGKSHEELVEEVGQGDALVVGLSAGGLHVLKPLSRLVIALRVASPERQIFVGGKLVDDARDRIEKLGVDGLGADMARARKEVARLWETALLAG